MYKIYTVLSFINQNTVMSKILFLESTLLLSKNHLNDLKRNFFSHSLNQTANEPWGKTKQNA